MINVTDIILNFQFFLTAMLKSFHFIGLGRGGDEWDELAESAYDTMVVEYLKKKYQFSTMRPYESWERGDSKNFILVKVSAGSKILFAKTSYNEKNIYKYQEVPSIKEDIEFYFVEFGSPICDLDNLLSLDYVSGIRDTGERLCVNKKNCEFFYKYK